MIRIEGLKLPLRYDEEMVKQAVGKKLRIKKTDIEKIVIFREALDARKKPKLAKIVTAGVVLRCGENAVLSRNKGTAKKETPVVYELPTSRYGGKHRPLVIGAGPAGLFGALVLAKAGLRPLIVEAGYRCERRKQDILDFCAGGELLPESNIQFGEGGAGMFSDGKLTTGTKDPRHRFILETMMGCGAPLEIGYQAKPHIGSDLLPGMSLALEKEITALGGEFLFGTKLVSVKAVNQQLEAVTLQDEAGCREQACDRLLLATGHSARNTVKTLFEEGVAMVQKPFSVGVRIEHLQRDIDMAQFGAVYPDLTSDYKLAVHLENGRSVYTFCMCPGGMVVPATSEKNAVVTNGMSEWARDGVNANSALLVSVRPEDFPGEGPLSGIDFQREMEEKAFIAGGSTYAAPVQSVAAFLAGRIDTSLGKVTPTYRPGFQFADLEQIFPAFVTSSLKAALPLLGAKLQGFDDGEAILTAAETRSSAPYRILRDEQGQSTIRGLFPAGEGSGYAGGIMSSAADGMKMAEKILADR